MSADPDPSSIIILVLMLLISGGFSASETALIGLTPAKIKAMQPQKSKVVRFIQRLKENPQKMLTTILLGNNVINTGATAYATIIAQQMFTGGNAITIVTAVMTLFILIFVEIIPKAVANRYPEFISKMVVYPLLVVEIALFPIVWILEKLVSGILRLFGDKTIKSVTEDELKAMVYIGAEEGELERHERDLIENVLDFGETEVSAIMTPRINLKALSDGKTVSEAIKAAIGFNHSRIPIYHGRIDEITGFISLKELLRLSQDESKHQLKLRDLELPHVIRCPETRKIDSLFKEMQHRRIHMAFVYDEHGGLEGLVTMEDILEELVGEIHDEDDDQAEREFIQRLDKQTILVSGAVTLKEIEDELEIELADYDNNDHISWIILDVLKQYPSEGEILTVEGILECKVIKISEHKQVIEKVRIKKLG